MQEGQNHLPFGCRDLAQALGVVVVPAVDVELHDLADRRRLVGALTLLRQGEKGQASQQGRG